MTAQLLRFIAVGSLNTLIGFSVILLLSRGLGLHDVLANIGGYAVGACCSYLLNKRFTFDSRKPHRRAAPAFALLIGLCLLINLGVLLLALRVLQWPSVAAQATAVLVYNLLFFLGSKLLVFKD